MLNKLREFIRRYQLLQSGDTVICAVSGGADSVALLFALYLLRDSTAIQLRAAHFNHGLRGLESDRDEAFVLQLCERLGIPLDVGRGQVVPGKKGLEAAAREARYGFLNSLPGKIATAHTADDNAETVLMHLVRGTGLKGLGGIAPKNGRLIRPMLTVTRQEILDFLEEYGLSYVTDSSNETDLFLRNRLRRHVMPLLRQENPRLVENMSAAALRLRNDEETLASLCYAENLPSVQALRDMPQALRNRFVADFLQKSGVPEPEAEHIALVERLIFSPKPSAKANFPGAIVISRCYEKLEVITPSQNIEPMLLPRFGSIVLPQGNMMIRCSPIRELVDGPCAFTVCPKGEMVIRSRQAGDAMRLHGGTKELKKLFIDRKIPAAERCRIPVIADDAGILGVYGIGVNRERLSAAPDSVEICFESIQK